MVLGKLADMSKEHELSAERKAATVKEWTLHMASTIIFYTLWGIALKEWKGTSRRTHVLIAVDLVVLIGSTVIVGYGNYPGAASAGH